MNPSRAWVWACAVSIFVTLGFVGMGMNLHSSAEPPAPGAEQPITSLFTSTAPAAAASVRSASMRLHVASVGIHTRLMELGLNPDGTLEVPSKPLLAGWYTGSPTPGQRGPSIIAGHVDSKETGPAVFYRLGQVKPGAHVRFTLGNDVTARFTVTAVRSYSKTDFPSRAVYGNTDRATLRLITCADWNEQTGEYDGNVVVFAELDPPGS